MSKEFAEFVQSRSDDVFEALNGGLCYLSAAFKAGGSPNAYHRKGLHLVVYAEEIGVLDDDLLLFLVECGSNLNLPAVKFAKGEDATKALLLRPELRQTVGEWVGAPNDILYGKTRMVFISTFDKPDYLAGEEYLSGEMFESAIICHSNKVVVRMLELGFPAEQYDLKLAADAYNRVAHAKIMAFGITPTKEHARYLIYNADLSRIWNTLIVDLARYGFNYTDKQKDSIYAISPTASAEITRLEKSPYWTRACRVRDGKVTKELREDALALGVYPSESKQEICERLPSADTAKATAECTNKDIMSRNYSDLEMVKYKTNDKCWCLTYEHFADILRTEENPFTGKQLPEYVLAEMRMKQDTFA